MGDSYIVMYYGYYQYDFSEIFTTIMLNYSKKFYQTHN